MSDLFFFGEVIRQCQVMKPERLLNLYCAFSELTSRHERVKRRSVRQFNRTFHLPNHLTNFDEIWYVRPTLKVSKLRTVFRDRLS
jgi:hypothetical protein